MFNYMINMLDRPALYKETKIAFWDDEHISEQMLKAHLDPEFDGASRKLAFIEKSVAWIKNVVPPLKFPVLLDLGCGPGIYAEKLAQSGFQVTGVDFSRRSINHAKSAALKKGLPIEYIHQNYLTLNVNKAFDFITLIYCDYGALSEANRKILMETIYRCLTPGGKLLLDVFSAAKYNDFHERQAWETHRNGGFWRKGEHIVFQGNYKYTDHVTLEQISVISPNDTAVYYLWNTYFTKETLIKESVDAGFAVCEVFGDVAGSPYRKNNPTIAILLEKS